uniref:Uncharacterized protein n=1 Tax=Rhizophagus irregularis (strain DAOM 181602 / DAOM 197198 / MUCL 43194) TaxID=747089 RepID=U9T0Q3_RHIID
MQLILNIIRTLQFACGLVCLVIVLYFMFVQMFIDIILSLLNIIGIERLENWDILFIVTMKFLIPIFYYDYIFYFMTIIFGCINLFLSIICVILIPRLNRKLASEIINVPLRRNNAVNNAGIETVETNNAGTEINNAGAEWNA